MFCPYCGKENPDHSQFCSYCGNTFSEADGTENRNMQGQTQQTRKGLSAGALIGLLAGIAAAAAFLIVFFIYPAVTGRPLIGGKTDPGTETASSASAGSESSGGWEEAGSPGVDGSSAADPDQESAAGVSEDDLSGQDADGNVNASQQSSAQPVLLTPENIIASSELAPYSKYTYYATHINDRSLETAWNEGVDGPGIGEYLELSFPAGTKLTGGIIFPAYYKNEDIFYKNNAPTKIAFSSGSEVRELDTSASASTYQENFGGQEFTFDEPLTCDGTLRVTILEARPGNKYDDTCISELQMKGILPADAAGAENQGNDSGTYGYYYQEDVDLMTYMAGQLYSHESWSLGGSVSEILGDKLTSDEKAFMLYWYQYNCSDSRIRDEGVEFHSASLADMRKIMEQLFMNVTDEDFTKFREQYVDHEEGDRCIMNATGDFGDAGEYYLGVPENTGMSGGLLKIKGHLMHYDFEAGEPKADQQYCLEFMPRENGLFGGFVFYRLHIGNDCGEEDTSAPSNSAGNGGSAGKASVQQSFDLTNGLLQVSDLEGTIFLFDGVNAAGETEHCVGLKLDAPVHVSSDYSGETDITEIQLGDDRGGTGPGLESLGGTRVRVSGEAFAAHTGHHHRDMILMVKNLEKV